MPWKCAPFLCFELFLKKINRLNKKVDFLCLASCWQILFHLLSSFGHSFHSSGSLVLDTELLLTFSIHSEYFFHVDPIFKALMCKSMCFLYLLAKYSALYFIYKTKQAFSWMSLLENDWNITPHLESNHSDKNICYIKQVSQTNCIFIFFLLYSLCGYLFVFA